MSVVPTSVAAVLASAAAATERASKVQTTAKESDQARRTKNGQQTGDRIVLSADAVQRKQSATDRSEGEPQAQQQDDQGEQGEQEPKHLDVKG